jgi:hypothetical protein
MVDFTRLLRNWDEWTSLARMTHVSVSADCDDCQVLFKSDDQSFHLRQDGDSWIVDKVDDRGQWHKSVGKFSTFDLAEKYLIWRWSSVTRSAIGAKQLGIRLHSLGMAPDVEIIPTEREGAVELRTSGGSAVVPRSIATIFSHLMSKSVDEIEQMVREGVA